VRKRRRPKKKATCSVDDEWEAVRKDAWLRELLTSSSEEEEQMEEKRTKMEEEKYKRFKESGRWLRKAASTAQKHGAQRSWSHQRRGRWRERSEPDTKEELRAVLYNGLDAKSLDLLDERADAIGRRLEQIEVKMGEIRREDEAGKKALAGVAPVRIQSRPNQVSERSYRCQIGRVMLLMGVLGVLYRQTG
jgi:hypothetical protein